MHKKYKVLEIFDEESLKKEEIDFDSYIKNFNYDLERVGGLKEKIEKEIMKINNLYEKINDEIKKVFEEKFSILNDTYNKRREELTKSYEEECKKIKEEYEINSENLLKEENNSNEILENKVTKVKEKLENYLLKTNNTIKENEKINKGIKKLKKKQENKNIIANLTYISKINKNKKELNSLFQEVMENLEISLNKDKNLNFDEYYFNGFPIPNNVKFIYDECLTIYWSKDDYDKINIESNKLKFSVEMKEEKNEKFEQVYEGKDCNFIIENLIEDNFYEFKIYS